MRQNQLHDNLDHEGVAIAVANMDILPETVLLEEPLQRSQLRSRIHKAIPMSSPVGEGNLLFM